MYNDIYVVEGDICDWFRVIKALNYDGRDVYILRGVEKYQMEKNALYRFLG